MLNGKIKVSLTFGGGGQQQQWQDEVNPQHGNNKEMRQKIIEHGKETFLNCTFFLHSNLFVI
jgi:hypothetical protein